MGRKTDPQKHNLPSAQDMFAELRNHVFDNLEIYHRAGQNQTAHLSKYAIRRNRLARPSDHWRTFSISGYVEGLATPVQTIHVTLVEEDEAFRFTKKWLRKDILFEIDRDHEYGVVLMIEGRDYGIHGASLWIFWQIRDALDRSISRRRAACPTLRRAHRIGDTSRSASAPH